MLHRRLHVALSITALIVVAAAGTLGATLPSDDSAQPAAIDVVTGPGGTTTVPVAAAAGIPADLGTLTVTGAGLGTLAVTGGTATYIAPSTVPATSLTGPARAGNTATVTREARPQLPITEPVTQEPAAEPTPPAVTPSTAPAPTDAPSVPSAPAEPTPATSPTPNAAPTPSADTEAGETAATAEPSPSKQPAETDQPAQDETAAPLLGTGADTPAPGDHITYQVCTTDRALCTDGTISVTFAPELLQPTAAKAALLETRQDATFTVADLFTNAAAADRVTLTASATRGATKAEDGAVRYTAPSTAGADTMSVTLCSLGDNSACATSSVTITVAPAFTTDTHTTVAIVTDEHGDATVTVPTRSDAGAFDPATLTITHQPAHGSADASAGTILLRLTDPAYSGADSVTWRACAKANRSNCQTSTITLSVNDGFGWVTSGRHTTAGLTTTLDAASVAADASRWGLMLGTVTLTAPNDITVSAVDPGVYRLSTSADRHDPFTVSICGEGRNHVTMCGTVRYVVAAITVLPHHDQQSSERQRDTVQNLLQSHTAVAPSPSAAATTAAPPASSSAPERSGGVDITWWVIGAAMLFGIGGGAGALRNRH